MSNDQALVAAFLASHTVNVIPTGHRTMSEHEIMVALRTPKSERVAVDSEARYDALMSQAHDAFVMRDADTGNRLLSRAKSVATRL